MESRDYQFSCLPFGLSCAPWVFTKTLKPVLTLLKELGVRLVAYIDNNLVLAKTKEMAQSHTEALIYLLQNLGYIIHPEKTVKQPTQEIELLGIVIHSRVMELRLPGQKIKKIETGGSHDNQRLSSGDNNSTHNPGVSRLLRKFNSVSQAVPPGPLFCRAIQRDLAKALELSNQCYDTLCHLSPAARGAGMVEQSLGSLDTSSNIGGKGLPKRSGKQEGIIATGQYDSCSIGEQSGRDSLRPFHKISESCGCGAYREIYY